MNATYLIDEETRDSGFPGMTLGEVAALVWQQLPHGCGITIGICDDAYNGGGWDYSSGTPTDAQERTISKAMEAASIAASEECGS